VGGGVGSGVYGTLNEPATGRGVGSGVGGGTAADKAMSNDRDGETASLMKETPEDARTVAAVASSDDEKRRRLLR
jgi:hypothetical protein